MQGTTYQNIQITLAAGAATTINAYGRYFRILENSITTNPMVRIGAESEQEIPAGLGMELPDNGENFTQIALRNPATEQMVLRVAVSSGKVDDNRLSFSGTVSSTETNSGAIRTAVEATKTNSDTIKADTADIKTNTGGLGNNTRGLNGDTGTQILKSGSAVNAVVTVLHTVTAGKNFYLTSCHLMTRAVNSGAGTLLEIVDGSNALIHNLLMNGNPSGTALNPTLSFPKPIKIPAGYKVRIDSTGGSCENNAAITGWEEDA